MISLTLIMMFMMILFIKLIKESNPVKMSLKAMVICSLTSITNWVMSGVSWISLIMIMLFLGGVLTIFLVVSSLYPNMNLHPSKSSKAFLTYLFVLMAAEFSMINIYINPMSSFKIIVNKLELTMLIMLVILSYFLLSFYLLTSEKTMVKFNY